MLGKDLAGGFRDGSRSFVCGGVVCHPAESDSGMTGRSLVAMRHHGQGPVGDIHDSAAS